MSFVSAVKDTARGVAERSGYWVRHRSVLPLGIDYMTDIARISAAFGAPVECFFDVGAHVGQTALAVASRFPEAEIYAFEPHPATFSELRRNTGNPRIKTFNVALSDQEGDAEFFEFGALATCNSLVANAQFAMHEQLPARKLTVNCTTLDRFCAGNSIRKIDVLKIDTEGHDLSVLQGGRQTLNAASVRFLYVEFNTILPVDNASGGALAPIAELLEPIGFRFVASYPELLLTDREIFYTGNALWARRDVAGRAPAQP